MWVKCSLLTAKAVTEATARASCIETYQLDYIHAIHMYMHIGIYIYKYAYTFICNYHRIYHRCVQFRNVGLEKALINLLMHRLFEMFFGIRQLVSLANSLVATWIIITWFFCFVFYIKYIYIRAYNVTCF